jgi:hypothetical protein
LGASAAAADGGDTEMNECNIPYQHAYTILAAFTINGHNLLMARNPWGKREWIGPWSDYSPCWE